MEQERRNAVLMLLMAVLRWLSRYTRGRRSRPPVGVREPRRPKPTLPAAAIALEEPRAPVRVRLTTYHDGRAKRPHHRQA
jgi:hypothetical protein